MTGEGVPAARRESWIALLVFCAAFLPRLIWVAVFPTRPFSDFRALVDFAVDFTRSPVARGANWQQFNAGLPLLLSPIVGLAPTSVDAASRLATVFLMSCVPLIPYLGWRGIFAVRVRIVSALVLALWPGFIFFSGVIAQDNWVVAPTIALAVLCVRNVRTRGPGYPMASALLFGLAVSIRQEMLVTLLPLALPAAGIWPASCRPRINLLRFAAVALSILAALSTLRQAATGRFALSTELSGVSVLGTFVPGAGLGWISPTPYVASVYPEVMDAPGGLAPRALALAGKEFLRRPRFHLIRMFAGSVKPFLQSDAGNLSWSIGDEQSLPAARLRIAQPVARLLWRPLEVFSAILLTAFVAVLYWSIRRRSIPILLLSAPVAIKTLLHVTLVSQQSRYNVPVEALMLLAVVIGSASLEPRLSRRAALATAAAAALLVGATTAASAGAARYIFDHPEQITYRFTFRDGKVGLILSCTVASGLVEEVEPSNASIRFMPTDLGAGKAITAECTVAPTTPSASGRLVVAPVYSTPAVEGRVVESIVVNGSEIAHRELPWERRPEGVSIDLRARKPGEVEAIKITWRILDAKHAARFKEAIKMSLSVCGPY